VKALVTGASGFIGQRLVRALVSANWREVRAQVRSETRTRPPWLHRDAEPVCAALEDPRSFKDAACGVDVVYHLAARLRGAPADVVANAAVATERMLSTLATMTSPPRVVLLSSFGVYQTSTSAEDVPLDEHFPVETRPEARDPYSFAKWLQERTAWAHAHAHGLPLVVVRAGSVWGDGVHPISSRVGFRIGPHVLHLGGDCAVPLCHVSNVVQALELVGRRAPPGALLNLVDDAPPSARTLARAAARAWSATLLSVPPPMTYAACRALERYTKASHGQLPFPLTEYRARSLFTPHRYDNARLKTLGWSPRELLATELGRTLTP